MINTLDELWTKIQVEFNNRFNESEEKTDKKFKDMEMKMNQRFKEAEEKTDKKFKDMEIKIDQRFKESEEKTDKKLNDIETRIDQRLNVTEDKIDKRFKRVEDKLEIITNTNIAQILKTVTETKVELGETKEEITTKLDEYIEKNELEHKKFECRLADIEIRYKYGKK